MGTLRRAALVALLLAPWARVAAAEPLPLLAAVAQLECGQDEAAARKALAALREAALPGLGLPSEQLGTQPPVGVHAAVLDIALLGLAEAAERRPELAGDLDALVASWNFCLVLAEGHVWDVEVGTKGPRRLWPVAPLPVSGEGLRRWGLDPASPGNAPRRLPASEQRLALPGRCEEGRAGGLYGFVPAVPSGPLPKVPQTPELPAELFAPPGEQRCQVPPPPPVEVATAPPSRDKKPEEKKEEDTPEPVSAVSIPSSTTAVTPGVPVAVRHPLPISGALFVTQRLTGEGQAGATVRWSPVGQAFVRVSLSYQLLDEFRFTPGSGRFSGSWGLGWEDWRPNTFSFTLNNWGPVRPDTLRSYWEGMEFDVAYRVPLPELLRPWVDVGARINAPLTRGPALGITLTGKPLRHLYLMTALRIPVFGDAPVTWSYSVGYASYRPYTLAVSYANWGPNRLSELNLVENGIFSLAFLWAPR
ncbi:hypothetical protein ATI61_107172 [Archangium gephyra]|uniref:Uncharacterized protein n=2 Tax=Archangium gephyra TaxID=48 RepID=A0AAC8TIV6_9BACT|nr:Hypothetical protein AA314_09349 [Archangium gephyra]REG29476.1 hypothetical protein ATI61_107172 [Archangium gephyra]